MLVSILAFWSDQCTRNGGDWLNLTTIQQAYYAHYSAKDESSVAIHDPAQLSSIIQQASQDFNNHYKLIFISDHGAKAISTLNDIPPNVEIIWSGHQLVANWHQLPVHTWYLPQHSMPIQDAAYRQHHFIALPGVVTSALATVQSETGAVSTVPHEKSLIWMLSGDARKDCAGDSELRSSWYLLTPDYASKVVQALSENPVFNAIKNVSIVNSPRTGQWEVLSATSTFFDAETRVQKTTYHSQALDFENNIDPITDAAQKAIKARLPDVALDIGHFWRQEPKDAGDAAVYHSNYQEKIDAFFVNPHAMLFIPGESVTEVSKIISSQYCLDHKDRVFVLLTDTMTPAIVDWVQDLYRQGYFSAIDVRSIHDKPILMMARDVTPAPVDILSVVRTHLDHTAARVTMTAT